MIDEHRGRGRHANLMQPLPPDDDPGGWMISYIDVMTLLVVLLVLIIALGSIGVGPSLVNSDEMEAEAAASTPAVPRLGIPLPELLHEARLRRRSAPLPAGELAPSAISAALGVAGLPDRGPTPPLPLARRSPDGRAPAPVSAPSMVLPSGLDLDAPLANTLLILTDNPPAGFQEVDERAIAGARFVSESLPQAPYLPDLEGMEVSRVPEGVRLRVEDRLLFPTADAELTDAGAALVAGRLRELVERYPGEVSVEGHSDSRPISTERFPSNWALSSGRAIAIVEALVAAGVEPSRLRAVGMADTRPLESNETAEGRARNRRVEVMIQAR
ncbi:MULTISPECIES: OmpA family protein [unclassified Halomonas]|uniref:OmpA/MotB family protein n=1 Tax=unclassified Halomonas TaxID=2609666 RepID=UPI002887A754|nr:MULTISPECIES: OmpA family protein [unclassified Halomonas]MDT0500481.1 OmpA family protein [Halomonas sp. PAR7]MDT0511623.1 OmpA family protein [Halomonas sp. LES1]MDT0590089.1 OmpA family protein [Halomonas sp. PAR8]